MNSITPGAEASQSATHAIKYIRKYDNRIGAAGFDIVAEFDDFDPCLPPLNPADMSVRAPHFLGEFALGKPSANSLLDQNPRQNFVFRTKNHVRQSFPPTVMQAIARLPTKRIPHGGAGNLAAAHVRLAAPGMLATQSWITPSTTKVERGRRLAGFKTAALVDGDVRYRRADLHLACPLRGVLEAFDLAIFTPDTTLLKRPAQ